MSFKKPQDILSSFKRPMECIPQEIKLELLYRMELKKYVRSCLGSLAPRAYIIKVKFNTLFIIFDHPCAYTEYKYKEEVIVKNLRYGFKGFKHICPNAHWTKVIAKQTINNILIQHTHQSIFKSRVDFIERSSGNFDTSFIQNTKLKEIFSNIQKAIQVNNGIQKHESKSQRDFILSIS